MRVELLLTTTVRWSGCCALMWPGLVHAATETWVFDESLAHVLLVNHRWQGWVAPGGKSRSRGEAARGGPPELFEETGVRAEPLPVPAAVTLRSHHPDWSV